MWRDLVLISLVLKLFLFDFCRVWVSASADEQQHGGGAQ
jgi:hypothetical protein